MLLDELISQQAFEPPDWTSLAAQLEQELDEAGGNTERQMDILRHFKQVQTLRLLTQDLAGTLPLETLSDHLSDLACLILEAGAAAGLGRAAHAPPRRPRCSR